MLTYRHTEQRGRYSWTHWVDQELEREVQLRPSDEHTVAARGSIEVWKRLIEPCSLAFIRVGTVTSFIPSCLSFVVLAMKHFSGFLPFLTVVPLAQAFSIPAPRHALPAPKVQNHQSITARDVCSGNTAEDRSTWCDYDLSTNYYEEVPDTGVTREYWFEVTNSTLAPDGISRIVLSINGSVPGPTIYADWGDTVTVHVTNSLTNNGTGIHWHG